MNWGHWVALLLTAIAAHVSALGLDTTTGYPVLASIIHRGRWLALAVPSPALIGPILASGYGGGPAGGPGARVSTGPGSLSTGCRDGFTQVRWAAEVRGYGATLS